MADAREFGRHDGGGWRHVLVRTLPVAAVYPDGTRPLCGAGAACDREATVVYVTRWGGVGREDRLHRCAGHPFAAEAAEGRRDG